MQSCPIGTPIFSHLVTDIGFMLVDQNAALQPGTPHRTSHHSAPPPVRLPSAPCVALIPSPGPCPPSSSPRPVSVLPRLGGVSGGFSSSATPPVASLGRSIVASSCQSHRSPYLSAMTCNCRQLVDRRRQLTDGKKPSLARSKSRAASGGPTSSNASLYLGCSAFAWSPRILVTPSATSPFPLLESNCRRPRSCSESTTSAS
eukprot:g48629.t1